MKIDARDKVFHNTACKYLFNHCATCSEQWNTLYQICNCFSELFFESWLWPVLVLVEAKWDFGKEKNDDFFLALWLFFVTAQSLGPFTAPQGVGWLRKAMLHCSPILHNSHALTQAHKVARWSMNRLDWIKWRSFCWKRRWTVFFL